MKRTTFIKKCGLGCLGVIASSWILESCATTSFIPVAMENGHFNLTLDHFKKENGFHRYLLVKPDQSDYPIVIYRKSEQEYQALLLSCTHQGTELNVYGDLISCPAHGSEFSNSGEVISGPASRALKNLPISVSNTDLTIQFI